MITCPDCGHTGHPAGLCRFITREEVRCDCQHETPAPVPMPSDVEAHRSLIRWFDLAPRTRSYMIHRTDRAVAVGLYDGRLSAQGTGATLPEAVQAAMLDWQTRYPKG